jgi:hypothetical protein
VIVPGAMPDGVEAYVRGGGRVLVAGTTPPTALPIGRVVGTSQTQGYWRIHDRTRLPASRPRICCSSTATTSSSRRSIRRC